MQPSIQPRGLVFPSRGWAPPRPPQAYPILGPLTLPGPPAHLQVASSGATGLPQSPLATQPESVGAAWLLCRLLPGIQAGLRFLPQQEPRSHAWTRLPERGRAWGSGWHSRT